MQGAVEDALRELGLTRGEREVYQALLQIGQTSVGPIAQNADIARSKIYNVLERLQEKGLVSKVIIEDVQHFDALPPDRLLDLLDEREQTIRELRDEVESVLPRLNKLREQAEQENKTVVYSGHQGPKTVLQEILEAGKNGRPHYGYGTDEDPYVEHFPHVLEQYVQEANEIGFEQKLIFSEGFESPNTGAEVRHLSKEYLSPVRIMIYGDTIAQADFTKPFTTIVTRKKAIAEAYKQHFHHLWQLATP